MHNLKQVIEKTALIFKKELAAKKKNISWRHCYSLGMCSLKDYTSCNLRITEKGLESV